MGHALPLLGQLCVTFRASWLSLPGQNGVTRHTSSTSYTSFGAVGVGTGGISAGVGDAVTETTGTNELAKRFDVPKPLGGAGCLVGVVAGLAVLAIGLLLIPVGAVSESLANVLASGLVLVVVVAAAYWYWRYVRCEKKWDAVNKQVLKEVRQGYYCERDAVAFSESIHRALTPGEFVDAVQRLYAPEIQAAIEQVPFLVRVPAMKRVMEGNLRGHDRGDG